MSTKAAILALTTALTVLACSAGEEEEEASSLEDNLFGFNKKQEGATCKKNSECAEPYVCRPTSHNHKGPTGLKCQSRAEEHGYCDEQADCVAGSCFVPRRVEQLAGKLDGYSPYTCMR